MLKCKVCGTANSSDSSVCVECGAVLRAVRGNNSTDSEKEIFSNTGAEELARTGEQKIDLFSSGEKYEKVRKGAVLEKIYKQEQAMGEVSELQTPPEPETVRPIVINRQTSSDIVGAKRYSSEKGRAKANASKNHKIPQRIIEPVDSQLLGHKIKPKVTNEPDNDENEKVELMPTDVIGDIRKRNKNSSKPKKTTNKDHENTDIKASRQNKPIKKHSAADGDSNFKDRRTKSERIQNNSEPKKNPESRPIKKSAAQKQVEPVEELISEVRSTQQQRTKRVVSNDSDRTVSKGDNVKQVKTKSNVKKPVSNSDGTKKAKTKDNAKKHVPVDSPKAVSNGDAAIKAKTKESVKKHVPVDSPKAVSNGDAAIKAKAKESVKKPVSSDSDRTVSNKSTAKNAQAKKSVPNKSENSTAQRLDKGKSVKKFSVPIKSDKTDKTAMSEKKSKKTSHYGNRFTESDIDSNKNIAALAYIGILFLIPLFKSKKSDFCKAHARQGFAVFIYSIIISLITLTAVIGLRILLVWVLRLNFLFYSVTATIIGILMLVLLLVPVFSGAVSAFSGVYKSVPIVGKYINHK